MKPLTHHMMTMLGAAVLGVWSCTALAGGHEGEQLLMPRFKFQAQSTGGLGVDSQGSVVRSPSHFTVTGFQSLQQYDATIYYPFGDAGLNLDLGLNIRYMDGQRNLAGVSDTARNLNETIPMVYASALFDLPFKGLSASVGGQHLIDLRDHSLFDYSATLNYRWTNGFGLQGGWKHQQYNLDNNDSTVFERKGLFLDLDYRF